MIAGPGIDLWPLWETEPAATGWWFSAERVGDELGAAFDAHPQLVLRNWAPVKNLDWGREGLVVRFSAAPVIPEADAIEMATELFEEVAPGMFSQVAIAAVDVGGDVVAPSLVEVGKTVTGAAAELRSGLPWLVFLVAGIAAIYLIKLIGSFK